MIPSRQTLRRVNGNAPSDLDVAGVDLILHLMSAVEVIRSSVYTRLHEETGLSEGKFSLLMSLRDAGQPISTGRLAAHLGVADATVSVMVKRMLAEETPLIARPLPFAPFSTICVPSTTLVPSALPRQSSVFPSFVEKGAEPCGPTPFFLSMRSLLQATKPQRSTRRSCPVRMRRNIARG